MLYGLLPAHHTWRIVCAEYTCSCTSSFESFFLVVSYQVNLYLLPGIFHFFLQASQCFGMFNLWQDVLNEFIKLLEVILHLADCSCIFTEQFFLVLVHASFSFKCSDLSQDCLTSLRAVTMIFASISSFIIRETSTFENPELSAMLCIVTPNCFIKTFSSVLLNELFVSFLPFLAIFFPFYINHLRLYY